MTMMNGDYSWRAYCVPNTILSKYVCYSCNPHKNTTMRNYYYSHFISAKTEAEKKGAQVFRVSGRGNRWKSSHYSPEPTCLISMGHLAGSQEMYLPFLILSQRTTWPWGNCPTSLDLCFLIYTMQELHWSFKVFPWSYCSPSRQNHLIPWLNTKLVSSDKHVANVQT